MKRTYIGQSPPQIEAIGGGECSLALHRSLYDHTWTLTSDHRAQHGPWQFAHMQAAKLTMLCDWVEGEAYSGWLASARMPRTPVGRARPSRRGSSPQISVGQLVSLSRSSLADELRIYPQRRRP